jgi:hypothetical protein
VVIGVVAAFGLVAVEGDLVSQEGKNGAEWDGKMGVVEVG